MSPQDRELLRRAASVLQALGEPSFSNFSVTEDVGVCLELGARRGAITSYWNPLKDDGEALRLAVRLQIDIKQYGEFAVAWFDGGFIGTGRVPYNGDPNAATRRAIVLAASAMFVETGSGGEVAAPTP